MVAYCGLISKLTNQRKRDRIMSKKQPQHKLLTKGEKISAIEVIATLHLNSIRQGIKVRTNVIGLPVEIYITREDANEGDYPIKVWADGAISEDLFAVKSVVKLPPLLTWVKCVNKSGMHTLTKGKLYLLVEEIESTRVDNHTFPAYTVVVDNFYVATPYHSTRFTK